MAAACGESGGGVTAGRPMKATVSDPGAGEGAFHGGLPGTLVHGGQIHPASTILGTRPEGRAPVRNSWEYPSQMPEGTTPGWPEPGARWKADE